MDQSLVISSSTIKDRDESWSLLTLSSKRKERVKLEPNDPEVGFYDLQ